MSIRHRIKELGLNYKWLIKLNTRKSIKKINKNKGNRKESIVDISPNFPNIKYTDQQLRNKGKMIHEV